MLWIKFGCDEFTWESMKNMHESWKGFLASLGNLGFWWVWFKFNMNPSLNEVVCKICEGKLHGICINWKMEY